jgi:hypothetical protein
MCPLLPFDPTADQYVQGGGRSEKFIGDNGLSSEFQIITKAPMGLLPGGSTKEAILQQWEESAKALMSVHHITLSSRHVSRGMLIT